MAISRNIAELIVRLKDEVSKNARSINSALGGMTSTVRMLAGAAGIGLGIGALIGFGKSVIDAAGHLQDLSQQTGISAQTLSGLKSVLEQSGTSIDAFAKGIFTAQKNIGEGSEEISRAIKALGLDFNQLRTASPEKFLELIAGALGKIEDPISRNALGAQLLGRSFKELSPALSEIAGRFDELKAKGISDADIKKLDQFGDAITAIKNNLQIMAAGPLAEFTNFLRFLGGTPITQLTSMQEQLAGLEERLKSLKQFGAPLFEQLFGKSTKEQIAEVEKNIEILKNIIAIAEGAKSKVGKIAPLDPKLIEETRKEMAGLEKELRSIAAQSLGPWGQLNQKQAEFVQKIKESKQPLEVQMQLIRENAAAFGELRRQMTSDEEHDRARRLGEIRQQIAAGVRKTQEEEQKRRDEAFDEDQERARRLGEIRQQIAAGVRKTQEEENKFLSEISQHTANNMQDAFAQAFDNIGTKARKMSDIVLGFVEAMRRSINQLLAQMATEALFGAPQGKGKRSGGILSNILSSIAGGFGNLFGGGGPGVGPHGGIDLFQEGGFVPGPPGKPRLAVVHGGEEVIPAGEGRVVKIFNIDARGAQRGVSAEIMQAIRASEDRAVIRSVHSVREERVRGGTFSRTFD